VAATRKARRHVEDRDPKTITALKRTGIGVVGDMKADLLETVVAYFKAGVEDYEFPHLRAPHEGRDVGRVATCPARSRPARVRPEHRDVPGPGVVT